MSNKIVFFTKVAKSKERLIITIPKQLRPLLDTDKLYKITLEEAEG